MLRLLFQEGEIGRENNAACAADHRRLNAPAEDVRHNVAVERGLVNAGNLGSFFRRDSRAPLEFWRDSNHRRPPFGAGRSIQAASHEQRPPEMAAQLLW